jgi:subtilisin family serine protease
MMREYIVTVKFGEDIERFYEEMVSEFGNDAIPKRKVEVAAIRENSLNTHFYLSDQEAEKLRMDNRVLDVTLLPEELGLKVSPNYTQTFSPTQDANWGLLRCFTGQTTPTTNTINITSTGKNVDVVISDGIVDPNHQEMLNGSTSKVIQFNWYQYNPLVKGTVASVYNYTPGNYGSDENDHGMHVAGTVAGNTVGWARDANIYNIYTYNSDTIYIFDYIREFHRNKPINPQTGRKNPTVVNCSWGYEYPTFLLTDISSIRYRGTIFNGPFTESQLESFGIDTSDSPDTLTYPSRYTPIDSDVEQAVSDGIIVLGAAGNNYGVVADNENGPDYDNYFIASSYVVFYNRGMSPGAYVKSICVSSASTNNFLHDISSVFTNFGPRSDLFAPGGGIYSSVYINSYAYFNGTSMATPQVAGVLSCALEQFPGMTPAQCKDYIINNSTTNQIIGNLYGSPNRYLFYKRERGNSGLLTRELHMNRRGSGLLFPRRRVKI